MKIVNHAGNLFDRASKGALLVHACNCRGVWGSGIAVGFRERTPWAYPLYQDVCQKPVSPLGQASVFSRQGDFHVGCLYTSDGYGAEVDRPESILENTRTALIQLFREWQAIGEPEVWSNPFNSGRFGVPWEQTLSVLEDTWAAYPGVWNVVDFPRIKG